MPLLIAATTVAAQPRPDPLDAQARVPAATAPQALRAYRAMRDAPPIPWREANATVDAIGGWRAYAREAQAAASAPAAPTAPIAPATVPPPPADPRKP